MPGGKDVDRLVAGLSPVLDDRELVFCSLSGESPDCRDLCEIAVGLFSESEGLTLILNRGDADRKGLPYEGCWRMITLQVYSSLTAVGLLAAVARRLAEAGIPVNVVSAFHHDHLFVPAEDAENAVQLLLQVQRRSGGV